MWVWVIGFVVVCTVIAVVISRRGPGDGSHHAAKHDPYQGGGYPGGGSGDGGGAG